MNRKMNFQQKLEKLSKVLPEYQHDELVWEKVKNQLEFEKKVDDSIVKLPDYEFENEIWERLESKLYNIAPNRRRFKKRKLIYYSLSAAAAIVLLIGLSVILNFGNDAEISRSVEYVSVKEHIEYSESPEADPIKFIEMSCIALPEKCKSPEFKEQKELLMELENERKNINEVISNFGESPELIKSLIKIENLRSEVIKDLVKTLSS